MFEIVRHYFRNIPKRKIKGGLTEAEARAHCMSPESSSRTATSPAAVARTKRLGPWFDGYRPSRRTGK